MFFFLKHGLGTSLLSLIFHEKEKLWPDKRKIFQKSLGDTAFIFCFNLRSMDPRVLFRSLSSRCDPGLAPEDKIVSTAVQ